MSPRNNPKPTLRQHADTRKPGDVHTIESFCRANSIYPSKYFVLKRRGLGPVEIKLGRRIAITEESQRDWRLRMERETRATRTT